MTYQVIDSKTQQVVGSFKSANAARAKRDRLDAQYGAVRFTVREDVVESSGRELAREFRRLLAD
jgi:hypothetical protein